MADDANALFDVLGRRTIAFRSPDEQSQRYITMMDRDNDSLVVLVPEHSYDGPQWENLDGVGVTAVTITGQWTDSHAARPTSDTRRRRCVDGSGADLGRVAARHRRAVHDYYGTEDHLPVIGDIRSRSIRDG